MKQVNIKWQCLAVIFIPTGLYAFKRIKKLRFGIIIYIITGIASILSAIIPILYWDAVLGDYAKVSINDLGLTYVIISVGQVIFSFVIPIIFIRQWSNEWNQQIKILT